MNTRKKQGFTLAELLAVVMIIAILSAIALPQYRRSIQRAEAVEGLTHVKAILDAAIRHKASYDTFPSKLHGLDVSFYNATAPEASTTDIDNFRFTFNTTDQTITACRLPSSATCSTYYFTGYYNFTNTAHPELGGKGVITCTWVGEKYNKLCEQFGDLYSGNTYLIN